MGLRFCARAFSSCGKRGPFFILVHGPLTIAASLVVEHRLQTCRLSSCGSRAQLLRGMWDLPQTRARTRVPCIGRRILNHCTTREAPVFLLTFLLEYNCFTMVCWFLLYKKVNQVASLVAQWLRVCLPMQGTRVRALVQEDPTYRGATNPMCRTTESHNY